MSGGVAHIGLANPSDIQEASSPRRSRLLSFPQLNSLAIMAVLASTGMVSPYDLAFVFFSLLYTLFLSRSAFPSTSPTPPPPVFPRDNRHLQLYVSAGALLGLLFPILYILHGLLTGDRDGIRAATPHVFLLASQVFMEGVTFSRGFALPVRVFVPVFYNARRLSAISEWMREEAGKVEVEMGRAMAGRALAMGNMAFWSFNLFGFLVPVYLPRAFKMHYGYKEKSKS